MVIDHYLGVVLTGIICVFRWTNGVSADVASRMAARDIYGAGPPFCQERLNLATLKPGSTLSEPTYAKVAFCPKRDSSLCQRYQICPNRYLALEKILALPHLRALTPRSRGPVVSLYAAHPQILSFGTAIYRSQGPSGGYTSLGPMSEPGSRSGHMSELGSGYWPILAQFCRNRDLGYQVRRNPRCTADFVPGHRHIWHRSFQVICHPRMDR